MLIRLCVKAHSGILCKLNPFWSKPQKIPTLEITEVSTVIHILLLVNWIYHINLLHLSCISYVSKSKYVSHDPRKYLYMFYVSRISFLLVILFQYYGLCIGKEVFLAINISKCVWHLWFNITPSPVLGYLLQCCTSHSIIGGAKEKR